MRSLTAVRWFFAIPLTIFGCFFYIASPLIGSGMHLDPMPGVGMLFAGSALAMIIGGYWLVRSQKKENILATAINVVLIFGAASLVYGLVRWGFEEIYQIQSSEEAHSRPGELLFRVCYGVLSVVGFVVINRLIRKVNLRTLQ